MTNFAFKISPPNYEGNIIRKKNRAYSLKAKKKNKTFVSSSLLGGHNTNPPHASHKYARAAIYGSFVATYGYMVG